jgi:hypothetical protein
MPKAELTIFQTQQGTKLKENLEDSTDSMPGFAHDDFTETYRPKCQILTTRSRLFPCDTIVSMDVIGQRILCGGTSSVSRCRGAPWGLYVENGEFGRTLDSGKHSETARIANFIDGLVATV